jgi:outer membrane protein TolC
MNSRITTPLAALLLLAGSSAIHAQISLGSAVDLAIRNSPRLRSSEADVQRAQASLAESKDVYIPNLNAGAGLGDAFGYSPYPPTLFTLNSSSLIYNAAQLSYTRSASAALEAAQRTLEDMRETVAEDAALTFVSLEHNQERLAVLREENKYADTLLTIVQERVDAGQDTRMMLLDAKLTVANLHLSELRTQEDEANDRAHLARLMGVPPGTLRADGGFPDTPITNDSIASVDGYANASVAAAFASARAKQQQAKGDAKFLYRPQFSLVLQYNRYETFTDSWKNIVNQYGIADNSGNKYLSANEEAAAIQISIPLLDRVRRQRALETQADANKALHDAEFAQVNVLDAQTRLNHTIELVKAQADVASLEQQRAQQQLEILRTQLQAPDGGPLMTPKDEQNSLINEREKYLGVVDATFQLHQAEISLLRQTGHLLSWLAQGSTTVPAPPGSNPVNVVTTPPSTLTAQP